MRPGYLAVSLLVVLCLADNGVQAQIVEPPDRDYTKIEVIAGPDSVEWTRYLNQYTRLSPRTCDSIPAGFREVTIKFIIGRESAVSDAKVIVDPGYGLGAMALRILYGYKGKWFPTMQGGRTVKSYKTMSMRFDCRPLE